MIELLGIVVLVCACTGVWLNNRKRRACFWLFLVSNALSLVMHVYAGLYQDAAIKTIILRDAAFIYLSIEGLILWSK